VSFWEQVGNAWDWYSENRENLTPLGALVGGALLAWAALRQARSATRQAGISADQAETARRRHEEQTKADYQRRITENFSKAIEQLGNDKIAVRLGAIYTLERISRESSTEYWTVMETLTAYVRERSSWDKSDATARRPLTSTQTKLELPSDIAAALAVIVRRSPKDRDRERVEGWVLNLRGSDLRGAPLGKAHLEGALFTGAHLEDANLRKAHLETAILRETDLTGADLNEAHLEEAYLGGAVLRGANLVGAHLEKANLVGAHLQGAFVREARLKQTVLGAAHLEGMHIEGGDLSETVGLRQEQLSEVLGDTQTILPAELTRPESWLK
jgi:hypothetical protein